MISKKLNLTFLHNELDWHARKPFLQFVEAHELNKVVSCLKLQLLDDNGRLALVHGMRLNPHT